MLTMLMKLRDRPAPLGKGGRTVVLAILAGALIGLGLAMTFLVGRVGLAAGWSGASGVFHVQHCAMITDPSSNNPYAQCTGLFQSTTSAAPPQTDATLANGELYPPGTRVAASSDGGAALVARTAENVRFYLGGVLCVLCFLLAALWILLPAIITGRILRLPRSAIGAVLTGAALGVMLIAGLGLTLAND